MRVFQEKRFGSGIWSNKRRTYVRSRSSDKAEHRSISAETSGSCICPDLIAIAWKGLSSFRDLVDLSEGRMEFKGGEEGIDECGERPLEELVSVTGSEFKSMAAMVHGMEFLVKTPLLKSSGDSEGLSD
jgi:hypothetical protein